MKKIAIEEFYEARAGVYLTTDICRLFKCGNAEVPKLIRQGVIPKPMTTTTQGQKRRWVRSVVDKKLGITPFREADLRQMVREEIQAGQA